MSLLLLLAGAGRVGAAKPLVVTSAGPPTAVTAATLLRNPQAPAGGTGPAPSLRALGAVQSGATLSPSFAAPAGAQATDVIVVTYFQDDARTTSTAPAGFNLAANARQTNDPAGGSPAHSLYVWWGRFSDVGAGPYVFTVVVGGGGTPFIEGRAAAIQDCITTGNPFEATSGNTSGNTAVTTAPSVSGTSTGVNRYAFYAATNWSGGAWTPASGFTEQWDANNEICTIDDKTLPTAQTVTPQAVCAGSNDSNAWLGIMLPVPGSVTPTGTPGPYVITAATPPVRGAATVLRSTLADPPVLTTRSPIVVTAAVAVAAASAILLHAPAPPAVSQQPIVVTAPAPTPAGAVLLLRSSLVDVALPGTTTPGPVVVTSPVAAGPPSALLLRGSLADAPVLTTVAPIVVTAPSPPPAPAAIQLRNPQPAAAIVSGPTTVPIVVTQPGPPPPASAIVLRSTLLDVPAPTPGPMVVTIPAPIRLPQAIVARGSLADAPVLTTASPLVVTTPPPPVRPSALLSRNPLPFIAPPSGPTTEPIVVTAAAPTTRGLAVLIRSTNVVCDCSTHRPNSGITSRPSSGTTARPGSGATARPGSGITARPDSGTTDRPCTCSGG